MNAYFVEWIIEENDNVHNGYTYVMCDIDFNYHVRRYVQGRIRLEWCLMHHIATKGVKCYCIGEKLEGDFQTINDLYDAMPSRKDIEFLRNACILEPMGRTFNCKVFINWWCL